MREFDPQSENFNPDQNDLTFINTAKNNDKNLFSRLMRLMGLFIKYYNMVPKNPATLLYMLIKKLYQLFFKKKVTEIIELENHVPSPLLEPLSEMNTIMFNKAKEELDIDNSEGSFLSEEHSNGE